MIDLIFDNDVFQLIINKHINMPRFYFYLNLIYFKFNIQPHRLKKRL